MERTRKDPFRRLDEETLSSKQARLRPHGAAHLSGCTIQHLRILTPQEVGDMWSVTKEAVVVEWSVTKEAVAVTLPCAVEHLEEPSQQEVP